MVGGGRAVAESANETTGVAWGGMRLLVSMVMVGEGGGRGTATVGRREERRNGIERTCRDWVGASIGVEHGVFKRRGDGGRGELRGKGIQRRGWVTMVNRQ